ncbi:MAG: hypothetical protein U0841_23845 [Chloroflexia bacterium]
MATATATGIAPVTLGRRILRAETAADGDRAGAGGAR